MVFIKKMENFLLKIADIFLVAITLALLVISIVLFVEFLITSPHLIHIEEIILSGHIKDATESLKELISPLLMFVIVIELIIMLIKHQPRIVFDVLLIAIAREIIIAGHDFKDVLLGVLSLLILFLIRKFLILKSVPRGTAIIIDPYITVEALNEMLDVHIPFEEEKYLVDLIERVAKERGIVLKKHRTLDIANVKIEILDVDEKGKPILIRVIKTA
ncbi:hypothetical protein Dester_0773 [Desulfurobacterium thermolithotrophum DSM 11699]|uniref:Transporter-associated domain-containing protein n=1 Tax=Desulfurobacterium thermolithotrophum (strain DSM 11699 / BSA) TaxID=868864 RepID=F0S3J2_DESTD|nr:hypothetical protein [Desulfurobacterium thermolithotrophum]ADY73414.1 hypothetical protein Dester_0773 [Desulfurobacterium thermolithotrophum DSM 11699]